MKLEDFTVIVDSREKTPWVFEAEEKKPGRFRLAGSQVSCLDAADYSILGRENLIRIERKAGFAELFGNMVPKSNQERFEREMEKLREIQYKYLVIETNLNKDLWGLSVPQFKYSVPCSKVFEWVISLQQKYNIVPIFAGDCGQKVVRKIFEQVLRDTNG